MQTYVECTAYPRGISWYQYQLIHSHTPQMRIEVKIIYINNLLIYIILNLIFFFSSERSNLTELIPTDTSFFLLVRVRKRIEGRCVYRNSPHAHAINKKLTSEIIKILQPIIKDFIKVSKIVPFSRVPFRVGTCYLCNAGARGGSHVLRYGCRGIIQQSVKISYNRASGGLTGIAECGGSLTFVHVNIKNESEYDKTERHH